jgi:hypothetical protein
MRIRLMVMIIVAGTLAGCVSEPTSFADYPDAKDIYDHLNNTGAQESMLALRKGLMIDLSIGQQDPGIPLRTPGLVVPVWRVTETNPATGERVEGHWKHLVVEEPQWSE